jgi:RND superfamily putative drug exporter
LKRSNNFAARMGRWSASHWKTAVFGWLAFVVVALFLGMSLGTKYIAEEDANVGEARTADHLIADAGFNLDENGETFEKPGELVLVQSKTLTAKDPAFQAAIRDAVKTLDANPKVTELTSPLEAGNADLISADGHSAMIQYTPTGTYEEAVLYIDELVTAIDDVEARHPGLLVESSGTSTSAEVDTAINGGLAMAGLISIPLTLIILVLVLGSFVAALIPLLLGITAVVATMGLVGIASQVMPMNESILEVVLLVGLAVGVDYALFYIKREREERKAGRSERAALEAAAATSGRAVLISGITVMIAMAGMFLSGDSTFMSFSVGTILVVAVAMIGSLTVLPALLSKLGDRVEKARIPFTKRFRRNDGEARIWGAVLDRVLRRPLLSAAAAAAVLVALAIPAIGIHTTTTGIEGISTPAIEPYERLTDAFPGTPDPAVVAIKADDVKSAAVTDAIAELERKALATGQFHAPFDVEVNPDGTVATVDVPLAGTGTDDVSTRALETLRETVLPQTLGQVDGVEFAVGGSTAASYDFNESQKSSVPLVFGFVLLFAFGLLLVSFRSIVIAVKAILLNLLSVAAAYGLLVAVFQWGWGENLLDFQSNGGVANWLPMFLFVILFGLSMDYHVFILSRVREAFDRGMKTEDAVTYGIKATASTVTSAAIVMVGVFSVFMLHPLLDLKEMGLGLAAAILIDATIVRGVLLPATMKLLGSWNWYLPKWLQWLPRLEHEPAVAVAPAPAPAPAPAAEEEALPQAA